MNRNARIGILGGGQLGQMLLEAQATRSKNATVLCVDQNDPAAQLAAKHGFKSIFGGTGDRAAIARLFQSSDVIIFESEFVDCDLLAEAQKNNLVEFVPTLDVMRLFQNKLHQKDLLKSLDIPGARHQRLPHEARSHAGFLRENFPAGAMLKWAWRGYDGKGNLRLTPDQFDSPAIASFVASAAKHGSQIYAEELVEFKRELAIIGCLSTTGEFRAYPLVVSQQRDGICLWVRGPASALGLKGELETTIAATVERLMRSSGLVGSAGFELFELFDGTILVNEIAPRVHNTGHFTQDSAEVSQFENHLRAVLGEPLGSTEAKGIFAMYNLLGPTGISIESADPPLPQVNPGMWLHWYGKRGIRPGRKLGHVNLVANSLNQLERAAIEMEEIEAQWHEKLRELR